jgi:hypothetical protein
VRSGGSGQQSCSLNLLSTQYIESGAGHRACAEILMPTLREAAHEGRLPRRISGNPNVCSIFIRLRGVSVTTALFKRKDPELPREVYASLGGR